MLSREEKQRIIKEHAITEGDTGSAQVQVALLSARIEELSQHLQKFPKDKHSLRGLQQMLGQRKAFKKYLAKNSK